MKPYIIIRLIAVSIAAFWIVVALIICFALR